MVISDQFTDRAWSKFPKANVMEFRFQMREPVHIIVSNNMEISFRAKRTHE